MIARFISMFTVRDLAEVRLNDFAIRVIPRPLDEVGTATHAHTALSFVIGRFPWTPVRIEHRPAVGPPVRPIVLLHTTTTAFYLFIYFYSHCFTLGNSWHASVFKKHP